MTTLKRNDGPLDGLLGAWQPTLKHSQITDGMGLPLSWEPRAIVACPACGAQQGVKPDAGGVVAFACGYARPEVPRKEVRKQDRRGKWIVSVREAAPAFACDFAGPVTLEGWNTAPFSPMIDVAAAEAEAVRRNTLREEVRQGMARSIDQQIEAEVDRRMRNR